MSLIPCTDPCVYQKDGYCVLSRAASSGAARQHSCVNFVPRQSAESQQRGQGLTDVGHPDEL